VAIDPAVDEAVRLVNLLKNDTERVPPIVISRLYRGGKTTLIDQIAKKLSASRYVITATHKN
jgi:predicted AAA+ superfamily ATPase